MLVIEEDKNKLIVNGSDSFDVVHTLDCGQCFRWKEQEDGSFMGIVKDKVTRIDCKDDKIFFYNTSKEDFDNLWRDYFDLDRQYSIIKKTLEKDDEVMREATEFGAGIHILKQDMWETLISFIISANNAIPRIKSSVRKLSEKFGNPVLWNDQTFYTFPSPAAIASAKIEELTESGIGFRAKYIKRAAEMVERGEIDLEKIKALNLGKDSSQKYEDRMLKLNEAMKELIKIPGVGTKVSSCVLLYGGQFYEAFPVDVWIKRIMEFFYMENIKKLDEVYDYAYEKFGNICGFAQQYLFYYARSKKIKEK